MSGVTLASTVGAITLPSASPPASTSAPLDRASSISPTIRSRAPSLMTGPTIVPWSRGSPVVSLPARSASLEPSSPATERSTTSFSVDMQIWPENMNAPKLAASAAASRSASGNTTCGALPPSSSRQRLRCSAHFIATIRPTRVEPVKFTRRTAGWAIRASTTSGASSAEWVTRLIAPAGTPASAIARMTAACVRGQCSDAFSTTVLPYANGVATARVDRITGAFHGAMPTTTPAG